MSAKLLPDKPILKTWLAEQCERTGISMCCIRNRYYKHPEQFELKLLILNRRVIQVLEGVFKP